jgi:hypothetical protein
VNLNVGISVGVCQSLLSLLRVSRLLVLTYGLIAGLGLILTIGLVGEFMQLTVGVAKHDKKV